jgi:hypothetical protein
MMHSSSIVARELGRVMFSRDEDFLVEAAARQRRGVPFCGLMTPTAGELRSGS